MACTPTAAQSYSAALGGALPVAESFRMCTLAGEQAESCSAAVVRGRSDAVVADCEAIPSATWQAECFFSVAERHARAHERWAALRACGAAGSFYAECLYHAWTYELQATVQFGVSPIRQLDRPVEAIRFWSSMQTVAGDPAEQLWSDWWYLALHGRVARLADCEGLDSQARGRCVAGTTAFVGRSVADFLQHPGTDRRLKDRVCRGGMEQARAALPTLYEWDPVLDQVVLASRTLACAGTRTEMQRPWNPIFLEWRAWVAG